ncbi:DUF1127 domain-containing protein [Roseivivax sp. CAU 1761]
MFLATLSPLARLRPHRLAGWQPLAQLRRWRALQRSRAALADLDDARLGDLGIDRRAAQREAARPFWDVPDHWRL